MYVSHYIFVWFNKKETVGCCTVTVECSIFLEMFVKHPNAVRFFEKKLNAWEKKILFTAAEELWMGPFQNTVSS